MSQKVTDGTGKATDMNQDGMIMPPPPSYDSSAAANTSKYAPPSGPPPGASSESYYQAHPIGGQQQQPFTPPAGVYVPPGTGYAGYAPQAGLPPGHPGGNPSTIVYVVDDGMNNGMQRRGSGMPVAMLCFILGLCTWVGYLFGMCFIRSKDPRERWWARACAIMCIVWGLVIIFASIFGRSHNNYNNGYYNGGY